VTGCRGTSCSGHFTGQLAVVWVVLSPPRGLYELLACHRPPPAVPPAYICGHIQVYVYVHAGALLRGTHLNSANITHHDIVL
jgi:hypothetical protein